jgi:ATP synthase protein I
MQEGPDPVRLQRLDEKIAAAKRATEPKPRVEDHYSAASQGWRMVIELVAGLGIGFGVGYGLDSLFGTMPIFLVLFILLGFAAGVRTMLRTAEEIQAKNQAGPSAEDERE